MTPGEIEAIPAEEIQLYRAIYYMFLLLTKGICRQALLMTGVKWMAEESFFSP